ncbi:MAG: peptidoglycan DD-metalloendopeptidase family protein [Anaerolineales bacterium]|nr:peptidoglycan DD-metalloendopeptidase family protein [Anaerolineales bacterium]
MMDENNTSIKSEQPARERNVGPLLQQIGLNMLMVGLIALLAFLAWQRFFPEDKTAAQAQAPEMTTQEAAPEEAILIEEETIPVELTPLTTPTALLAEGISRKISLKTIIPTRPRVNVITYTVQMGDTLFSIAYSFSLKPETILWGNFDVLNDNPHFLKPNQVLNILPTDGTYYQWKENDTLGAVADTFKVDPQAIVNYAGNNFDLTQVGLNGTGIEPGNWLIIPGGKRDIKDWGPPAITRQNAAAARYYGSGACGAIYEGAIGTGTFVWPTTDRTLSGYTYDPAVHPAIDIGGAEGNPIYATDSGVIVYSGWSDYGYGYLIVIDHGNGWQSAYAHLSAIAVGCGQSVYQGGYIGALGTTGNSSGPHLHFELAINGVKVNPLDYLR